MTKPNQICIMIELSLSLNVFCYEIFQHFVWTLLTKKTCSKIFYCRAKIKPSYLMCRWIAHLFLFFVITYYIIHIQQIYQNTFHNLVCQYLSFLSIFFNRFYLVENVFLNWNKSIFIFSQYFFSIDFVRRKIVGLPHIALYCDSLTLIHFMSF